jgi:transcriptional regulator PpsR
MIQVRTSAPDIKLVLDREGVILEAALSDTFGGESTESWIGAAWADTVQRADGVQLENMLEDARNKGVSAFRQLLQRLPSGLELPIEYTAVRLDNESSVLVVGKNLHAVTELQNRLVEAQQSMERDYWKLREVETRYRLLFNSSAEAVLLLDAANLSIIELNPAGAQALGLPLHKLRSGAAGRFLDVLLPEDRDTFSRMLRQVRERGRAPGILLRLGEDRDSWTARASLMASTMQEIFLVQLFPSGAQLGRAAAKDEVPVEDLLEHGPDGFVVIDNQGALLRANRAFLDMVQMSSETAVLGEPLGRWLGRPGADLTVLLANVMRLGAVRLFSTTLHGELGSEIEVEISAAGNADEDRRQVGVFLRDVGRRLSGGGRTEGVGQLLNALTQQIGKTTLRKLVDDTVQVVEHHYIEAALELTGGNRTAAAELLGLSRQSLYVKLNRYGLDNDEKSDARR